MKCPLTFAAWLCGCILASVTWGAEFDQRLANVSTRAQVGTGGDVAVVGFVIGPGAAKQVLIRAVGPTLAGYGVSGPLADPQIEVFNSGGQRVLSNDNWSTAVSPALPATVAGFSSVGAFAFSAAGSRDAALIATLAPGSYTAQVKGANNGTGIALVEVYDVTGSARLLNLSTRAHVGTGAGIMISGIVIAPGGGARKILIRAAGPALGEYGVAGVLSDPAIAVLDARNVQIAANDNWSSVNASALTAAFSEAGAFPFAANSKDAALLVDLAPGASYTIQVSGVGGTTGNALVEVYDLTAEGTATVSVSATNPTTDAKGAPPAVFTVTRTGSTSADLTVYYRLAGSAINGVDYARLPGSAVIPAGATLTTVNLTALDTNASTSINKDVTLQLTSGTGYGVGASGAATATIFFNPGSLYIAALRTVAGATSTAFGTATLQVSGDDTFGSVNLTFSNLSSPQTAVYLRLGSGTEVGAELLRVPTGQVSGLRWTFGASGTYTAAQLREAIRSGQVYVDVQTASYPTGELRGTFIQSSGSMVFTPPAAPPAYAQAELTSADAARFLTQGTFGPTAAEIEALTGKPAVALATWIDAQMALAPSLHLEGTDADFRAFAVGDNPQYSQQNRLAAWWKIAVTSPDQLRQRVAFALSELLVVSDVNGTLNGNARAMANYYDLLVRGAFGNYRDLLEQVTLSPVMGVYLSSLRNGKATFDRTTGRQLSSPDENYAREIMQLFTIGLTQLQPDGTLKLDALGLPLPTYNQTTITELAKVFTGWSFSADTSVASNFRGASSNYFQSMVLFPMFHDDTEKTIVGGVQLPAGQGGLQDLRQALDTLFQHPNTGPFVARQLIQRLVTSNPSPGYVYRVAQVFADNGHGVRGDLGAVVRAILLDFEARSPAVAATASFGKLKEPLLRVTAVMRAFDARANNGRWAYLFPENQAAQAPLRAPTVFNFFEPNFVHPGLLATSGLYAPEFQITNDSTAITLPNMLWNLVYANRSTTNLTEATVGISLESLMPLASRPAELVAQTNLILAGGMLPPAIVDRITKAIGALAVGTTAFDTERVRSAIYLTVTVPQGAVQK